MLEVLYHEISGASHKQGFRNTRLTYIYGEMTDAGSEGDLD
jgi:hypothetical protein